VPTLERLLADEHDVALVVTQPDRPQGRGLQLTESPVKQLALSRSLPITQPEKIKNNHAFRAQLEAIAPEAIIVVAYGRIVPPWMLELPRHGNLNLHASLLPKYRGAAPIQWAIANSETVTGNTIMRIDEGLDTGDILLMREMPIAPDDTSLTLAPRLAAMGADLMAETLLALARNALTPRRQDDSQASLAPILSKADGEIDWKRPAKQIHDRFRGFQPWPGAFTSFRGKKLTVHACHLISDPAFDAEPGTTLIDHRGDLSVVCGDEQFLTIDELQLEGKKRVTAAQFISGYRLKSGELLGR